MDNDKCRTLIRLYGTKQFLWNSKCSDYHNKSLRKDAWNEISAEMGLPVTELKKKMTTLLASYRREKSRINKSLITGSGVNDIYVSKWFAFDDFDFMKDKDVPNETFDTLFDDDMPSTQNDSTNDNIDLDLTTQLVDKPVDVPNKPDHNKRQIKKKKSNLAEDEVMLQKAFDMLNETSTLISSSSSTDQYFTYGQHIANELRKYDPQTLIYVKHAINNIIYEADLGKYSQYGYNTQGYERTINHAQYPYFSMYSYSTPSSQPLTPHMQPPTPSPQPPTPSPQPPTPSPQPPTPSPQPPTPSPQPPTPSPQPPTPSPQPPTPSPQPPTPSPQPPTPSPLLSIFPPPPPPPPSV